MEPVAMLRSQISVREQFQDGSEDISVHCQYLSVPFILHPYVAACAVRLVVYGALESVTVLWLLEIIVTLLLLLLLSSDSSGKF